jgi:hypothetical protein
VSQPKQEMLPVPSARGSSPPQSPAEVGVRGHATVVLGDEGERREGEKE